MIKGLSGSGIAVVMGIRSRGLIILLWSLCCIPAAVSSEAIRVAYCTDCVPFHYQGDDGNPQGLIIDLWKAWSEAQQVELQFLPAKWNQTIEMVRDGTADAHAGLFFNEDRDLFLDFGTVQTRTDTHLFMDNSLPILRDINELVAYKVGVLKGDFAESYLQENYPSGVLVPFDDYRALMQALERREILVFAADTLTGLYHLENQNLQSDYRISADQRLYANKWHVAVKAGNATLLEQLNDGFDSISAEQRLQAGKRWRSETSNELVIALDRDYSPFSKLNPLGEPAGFMVDYWRLWSQKSGLDIRFLLADWELTDKLVRAGEVDIHGGMLRSEAGEEAYRFSDAIYSVDTRLFVKKDADTIPDLAASNAGKIGIIKGHFQEQLIRERFPELDLVAYDNWFGLVSALDTDAIVALMSETETANTNLKELGLKQDIVAIGDVLFSSDIYAAVSPDNVDLLRSINYSVDNISDETLADIAARWMDVGPQGYGGQSIEAFHHRLTKKEKDWIARNIRSSQGADSSVLPAELLVAFYDNASPYSYVDEDGVWSGFVVDLLALIARRAGMELNPIDIKQLDEPGGELLSGNSAVIGEMMSTTEPNPSYELTDSYIQEASFVFVLNGEEALNNLEDLKGKRLAIHHASSVLPYFVDRYPEIEVSHVKSVEVALSLLRSGEIDGFLGLGSVVNHYLRKNNVKDIDVAFRVGELGTQLAIGVPRVQPELQGILNKMLASIKTEEWLELRQRWLLTDETFFNQRIADRMASNKGRESDVVTTLFVSAALLFGLLVLLVLLAPRFLKDETLLTHFGSSRFRNLALLAMSLVGALVVALAWNNTSRSWEAELQRTLNNLTTVLERAIYRLDSWKQSELNYLSAVGRNHELVRLTRELQQQPQNAAALIETKQLKSIRQFMGVTKTSMRNLGFFIINQQLINIASSRDENLGVVNLVAAQYPELIAQAFAGKSVFVPPIESDVHLSGLDLGNLAKPQSAFFLAPIVDDFGNVIAVLSERISMNVLFEQVTRYSRLGASGESYVIDAEGRQLTPSRFNDQLHRIPTIRKQLVDSYYVRVKDPGLNLVETPSKDFDPATLSDTRIVEQLFSYRDSSLLGRQSYSDRAIIASPYRDYRGVPVFGVGVWSHDSQLGLIAELDADEALYGYYLLRDTLILVTGLTLSIAMVSILMMLLLGERATRTMRRANQQLEEEVAARTHELQQSEANLWDLYENAPIAYATLTHDGRFIRHNKAMADLCGISRASFDDCNWKELISSDSQFNNGLDDVVEMGERLTRICTITDSQGKVNVVSVNYLPVHGEQEIRASVADITRQEEALRELRRNETLLGDNERRLRSIIDAVPDAVILINRQGIVDLFSPAAERIFGYSADEVVGQNIKMLMPAQYANHHDHYLSRYLDSGEKHVVGEQRQVVGQRKDGRSFPMDLSVAEMTLDEGIFYIGIVRDITANLEAQRKLKDNEARLDAAAKGGGLGIWDQDMITNDVLINETWVEMLGYESAELREEDGKWALLKGGFDTWGEIVHPDDTERNRHDLEMHINGETEFYSSEVRLRTKSGEYKWVLSVGGVSARDESGAVQRLTGVHIDIDNVKRLQEELATARSIAEGANRAKSDFLANMSHEIRTPMNAIIGMSHLALQTRLNDRQKNYIEKVHRSAESLLGIINDILDFSKIEAGKLDIEQIPFQLEDVFEDLANFVGLKAEEKGLELLFDIPVDLDTALIGDPLRLGQILVNVGNNAVKFTEQGEIVVSVRQQVHENGAVELKFAVTDSGIGMTAEQIERLFSAFNQADSSTTRKFGGTGLGLTICKRLTALMGGDIDARSEAGKGSTFRFNVFVERQDVPQQQLQIKARELLDLSVLMVDDNTCANKMVEEMLLAFGFQVVTAFTGHEAVKKAQAGYHDKAFDIIIMDWLLPDIDGIHAIREIRSGTHPDSKIILYTAHGREDVKHAAKDDPVDFILIKPVTPSTLLDAIASSLGKERIAKSNSSRRSQEFFAAVGHLRGAHLLLVEDNEINRELAVELLENNGLSVEVAVNGAEALTAIQERPFDGVLMDIQMPVMDGYTATLKLRQLSDFKDLPVLAMTANAMTGDREKALAAGMNGHIAKPININELFVTMAKWITPANPLAEEDVTDKSLEEEESLPSFKLINSELGLGYIQNDARLYRKLLIQFRDSQSDAMDRYNEALSEDDWGEAIRVVHTLKGLAASLGATSLIDLAARMESDATEGRSDKNLLAATTASLGDVVAELAQLQEAVIPETIDEEAEPIDEQQIQQIFGKLLAMLEDYDVSSSDYYLEVRASLKAVCTPILINRLGKELDNYDYDLALETMRELQSSRNSPSLDRLQEE